MSTSNQEQLDQNIKENWFAGTGVRKPYTVFVCIMAIIILGVFAFSKMTVDLFPSMNLPYAVVVLSPNQSYLATAIQEKGQYYQTHQDELLPLVLAKVYANTQENYANQADFMADKTEFESNLNDNSALATAASNGNQIATYYNSHHSI